MVIRSNDVLLIIKGGEVLSVNDRHSIISKGIKETNWIIKIYINDKDPNVDENFF